MGIFSFFSKGKKVPAPFFPLKSLPGNWVGPGKTYTPAGTQDFRVELNLSDPVVLTGMTLLKGRMITFFPSDSKLTTDVELRLSGAGYWSLVCIQTNVHGLGKLTGNKLEFSQKDPSGKTPGETVEIWTFLSPEHLFIENFILGPSREREPFLKIMLQKS